MTTFEDGYRPISDYGIIGDTRGLALVNSHGGIDWCSMPHLDSPAFLLRILDAEKGGGFDIRPVTEEFTTERSYWEGTNVLETRFMTSSGSFRLIDAFAVPADQANVSHPPHELIRVVEGLEGEVDVRLNIRVTPDYARQSAFIEQTGSGALCWNWRDGEIWLAGSWPLQVAGAAVHSRIQLQAGERYSVVLSDFHPGNASPERCFDDLEKAAGYWRNWLTECTYTGRFQEIVERSALTLKLMTFKPTGAIIAAATTSLPEEIGGSRNWDYRFCWLRDATLTLYALGMVGLLEEMNDFMHWIEDRSFTRGEDVQIVYGVRGERDLTEQTLDHLQGYRDSRPVRIGNGAFDQKQLDIYGEILDCAYLFYYKWGGLERFGFDDDALEGSIWRTLSMLVEYVVDHWREKDAGLWEVRGGPRHFTHSKIMCWVAVQRGIRLAEEFDLPADLDRWQAAKKEIRSEILKRGYSENTGAFTQSFDSDELDASVLLMPLVKFISANDERMENTINAIMDKLMVNGMIYRYLNDDGLPGAEGTFTICTFWLINNLIFAGRIDEAWELFEQMMKLANDLGLSSEEINPSTGEFLGNFPQAFTHIALINTAVNMDEALQKREAGDTDRS